MSISVQVVNTSWGSSTSSQIADLGRRISSLEAARTVIEAGTITAGTIAAGSITSTEIAAGTITASDIATGTITASNIASGTITATQIAANTITAGNIAAGTITATQIAAGSITTGNIAAGAITASLIQSGAINAGHIQAGSITTTQIAANTILASNIAAGVITATQIAAATILAGNIAAGTITSTQIAAATITAGNIVSHTLTALQIAAGTITATEIAAATITGGLIAATTITAANIASGTITSTQLAANSVTATQIVSGAVTSTKISVTDLSAISANLGAITAGTITGATVQTGSTGSRVVLNTGGITAYNAANTPVLAFDTATGNLTLTGTVNANASSVLPVAALTGGTFGSGSLVQDGGFEDATLSAWAAGTNTTLVSVGVPTSFVPSDIAGLEIWSRPESLGTNGTSTSAWTNEGSLGGTISQATGSRQPVVTTNVIDGRAALLFDGVDDRMTAPTMAADATRTIFVVAKQSTALSAKFAVNLNSGPGAQAYGTNSGTQWSLQETQAGGIAQLGGTPTSWSVLGVRFNSTSSADGFVNGNALVNYDPADGYSTATVLGLGEQGNNGGYWNGHVAEVIVFNSALSETDRARVLGYLSIKYPSLGTLGTATAITNTRSGARSGSMAAIAGPTLKYCDSVLSDLPLMLLRLNETSGTVAANAAVSGAYSTVVTASSPALWWRFDEPSGTTAADSSGNGRTGTYSGVTLAQASLVPGEASTAIDLNGGAVTSTYDPLAATGTTTVEGWATRDSASGAKTLFSFAGSSGFSVSFGDNGTPSSDSARVYVNGSNDWNNAFSSVPQGGTFHFAMIFNNTVHTAELYINGVSRGVLTGLQTAGTGPFVLGTGWTGNADEIAVYTGALTAAQIAAHAKYGLRGTYAAGVTLNQTGATGDGDKAALFNNSTSAVVTTTFNPFQNGTTRTYEGIFKRTASTDEDALFTSDGINLVYLRLEAGSGGVRFKANDSIGTSAIWASAWPGNGVFVHWALTFNENTDTAELFINGTSQGTRSMPDPYGASPGNIRIGDAAFSAGALGGVMDEFAVYTTGLTSARIAAHAASVSTAASTTINMDISSTSGAKSTVQAGANHTASAWFKAAATPRTVRVHINWYTSANAFISTSLSTASTVDSTTSFKRTTLTALAPSNAAFARVVPEVVGLGASGEVHYVDDVTLQYGDVGTDSPGIPSNTIVGGMIVADQITAREIAASSITAVEIAAATITAGNIATGTITSVQIAAGTISATQLSATAIDSMIVTGATIQTNTNVNQNKVILDAAGLRAYGTPLVAPDFRSSFVSGLQGLAEEHIWALSEPVAGGTNANDFSNVAGQQYVYLGGYTRAVPGMLADGSTATSFNGSTGEVGGAGASTAGLSSFTLMCGFKTTTTSGGGIMTFVDTTSGTFTNNDRKIWMDNAGKIWFGITPAVNLTTPLSYNDGNWHRVWAVLKANNNMELWIDGALVASNSNTTAPASYSGWWRIARGKMSGWPSTTTSDFFNGSLSHASVFRKAVDSNMIAMAESLVSSPYDYTDGGGSEYGLVNTFFNVAYTLAPNIVYYYAVTAINSQGETPIGFKMIADGYDYGFGLGNVSNRMEWSPVAGASGYRVYRSTTYGTYTQYFTVAPLYFNGAQSDPQGTDDDGSWTMIAGSPPVAPGTAATKIIDVNTSGVGIITSPTIRTNETFPRVQLDSTGLIGYDETGDQIFFLTSGGNGLTLRAGPGDKNTIAWAAADNTSMGSIWAAGTDSATAEIHMTTKKLFIQSGNAPAPGSKRYTTGLTTLLTADGTTLTVGYGATGNASFRKLLNASQDSDYAMVVYKRQLTATSAAGNFYVLAGAAAGVYMAWIYVHGANRVASSTAVITKPAETNLTPGIFSLNDGAYTSGPADTSITDANGFANSGHVLVTPGNDGVLLNYVPNGVACDIEVRVMRMTPMLSNLSLG